MFLLIPIAFISGVLTVFSPCVLPILPIVLASGIDGKVSRIRGIIVGLVISFTLISLSLAFIVSALGVPADTIRFIAVLFLLIFGISILFPKIWETIQGFIERYWHIRPIQSQNSGFWGGLITGGSLGVVWSPCVGPIVATIATLAAVNSFSASSVLLMFSYALGTGIPLYFIAKGGSNVTKRLGFFKQNSQQIRQVFGVVMLATALFIWTGFDRKLQAWTLEHLPSSWTQLATNFEQQFDARESLQSITSKENIQSGRSGLAPKDSVPKAAKGTTVVRKVKLQDDFTGAKVKPSDLLQGCFGGQDCIPSIDKPQFETVQEASWLQNEDVVFAIDYKGIQRAYPQRILNWHEIVNDTLRLRPVPSGTGLRSGQAEEIPVAITFCPLCGSALAFERKVDGVITEFGVSGKLHNSDLVMYDRYEGNLWQQITGEGIVGPAARRNEVLKQIPIVTTTWGKWQKEHPSTQVLSLETGHVRDYDAYPYGTYEQDDELYFGVKNLNKKLQIKTVVYGMEVNGASKAYPKSAFDKQSVISDTVGGIPVRLEKTNEGKILATNLQTQEEIIPIRLFWFAWASFHPNTELYE